MILLHALPRRLIEYIVRLALWSVCYNETEGYCSKYSSNSVQVTYYGTETETLI